MLKYGRVEQSMKIIFVIVSLAGGGAERVISILANQFVKKGIDVTVMMTAGDEVAYPIEEKVHLLCIGGRSQGRLRARIKRIKKMRDFFKENSDSIIISFGPGTSFFTVLSILFMNNKLIISERNDPAICRHKFIRNIVYSRAQTLVYQTKEAMMCFPEKLRKKGCVIPNPVSKNLPQPIFEQREKTIVAVGRLEPQKNHKMLIRAFAIFSQQFPEYKLYIYGQGDLERELTELAEALGVEETVILKGFVREAYEKIRNAGIYALSSDYEGISNSLLEAMAMGIPSISTDCPIGGSKLCIQSYENGILTPVGDEKTFAKALKEIAGDKELEAKLSRNASKIRNTYSEENIAVQWLEAIR